MTLYVGLGNPGPTYAKTRHNIGFRVIDRLVAETGARDISKKSFEGHLYREGDRFFLKPLTFMNLSGRSVKAVMDFYKIPLEDLVVIHDDIDLSLGTLRYKVGGSSGGHNGLKSIDAAVGGDYLRLRIGVGKPARKSEVVSYVLSPFTEQEEVIVEKVVEAATDAALKVPTISLNELKSRYTLKGSGDAGA
ncbi:aminoacyl-tRNA hydrolase [Nitratifractor sp.]|uniref:aminoacyl-tRNA hydrolase n=1 Tax=Nitratifractor sp. TaxID=2268144 RepID=UPI0025E8E857|nr:aminoacyl-tRNA hydrolase [Nitratifractor sp.]